MGGFGIQNAPIALPTKNVMYFGLRFGEARKGSVNNIQLQGSKGSVGDLSTAFFQGLLQ